MISKGEVITDYLDRQALVRIMGGECALWFGGFSPYDPNTFYWGWSLISAGEVITDDEKMGDLLEVMTDSRFGYDGPMGVFDGYGEYDTPEPDVDESQEWHDYDPYC